MGFLARHELHELHALHALHALRWECHELVQRALKEEITGWTHSTFLDIVAYVALYTYLPLLGFTHSRSNTWQDLHLIFIRFRQGGLDKKCLVQSPPSHFLRGTPPAPSHQVQRRQTQLLLAVLHQLESLWRRRGLSLWGSFPVGPSAYGWKMLKSEKSNCQKKVNQFIGFSFFAFFRPKGYCSHGTQTHSEQHQMLHKLKIMFDASYGTFWKGSCKQYGKQ